MLLPSKTSTSMSFSSNGADPAKDLLSTTEYISFGHVVRAQQQDDDPQRNLLSQPAHRERLPSDLTSITTPTFKKELSLFPMFDKFILYSPTYVIRGRRKRVYIPCLIIIIVAYIMRAITHALYFLSSDRAHHHYDNHETQVFVAMMFVLPFINNIIRLHFFIKHFDFKLWHYPSYINPSSSLKTINDQILNRLSYLLRRPAFSKKQIGKRFRKGWYLIMFIILTLLAFRIILSIKYMSSMMPLADTQWTLGSDSQTNDIYVYSYSIISSVLFLYFFDIPDLLCLLTARIHFIECQLYLRDFAEELSTMSLDEIVDSNVYDKYLSMYKRIKLHFKPFEYFISIIAFEIFLGVWYGVNWIFADKTWDQSYSTSDGGQLLLWGLTWSISTLSLATQFVFALYPALKINELNEVLIEHVNTKIDDIMTDRQTLHDEDMLKDLMNVVYQKSTGHKQTLSVYAFSKKHHDEKTLEMRNKIAKYSIQKSALDILQQLLSEIEQNPCSYTLFGVTINRSSLADIVIGLIITQLLSILWRAT